MSARSLEFDSDAVEDLIWWVQRDRKKSLRILRLIQETERDPFGGIGKPEPLKHELSGCWSKRIDDEHRLVYQVFDEKNPHPCLPFPLLTVEVHDHRLELPPPAARIDPPLAAARHHR